MDSRFQQRHKFYLLRIIRANFTLSAVLYIPASIFDNVDGVVRLLLNVDASFTVSVAVGKVMVTRSWNIEVSKCLPFFFAQHKFALLVLNN